MFACCAFLYFLKPNDRLSAVTSAYVSSANLYRACIALSYIVGIPKDRFSFLPILSINTLFNGFALYFLSVNLRTAFILASGVDQSSPSIPAVLLPLF